MKQLILLPSFILLVSFCFAQTKILDRSVDYTGVAPVMTLYLSDSLVTNVSIKVGDTFGTTNSINTSYSIDPTTIEDNMLVATLSSLAPGDHFFEVAITSENETSQVVQFKTHH